MCQLLSVKFATGSPSPSARTRGPVELLEVGPRQLAALGRELLEVRKLAEADPRGDVGQVELPADQLDLHAVVAGPHDALEPVLLGELRLALVVHDEAPALDGRDVLVRVKAERDEVAEGADPAAPSRCFRRPGPHPRRRAACASPAIACEAVAVDREAPQGRPG